MKPRERLLIALVMIGLAFTIRNIRLRLERMEQTLRVIEVRP